MKPVIQKLVDLALAEVGTREEGGNNCGKDIREYQSATWLEPASWPWCAAFTAWLLREWLKDPEVPAALGIADASHWRCKSAAAFVCKDWAKARSLQVLPETAKAKAGDLVIFDFSHIGIVVADQVGTEPIKTCEGNTTGKDTTLKDSLTGDGVWLKKRNRSLVKCYIRLLA